MEKFILPDCLTDDAGPLISNLLLNTEIRFYDLNLDAKEGWVADTVVDIWAEIIDPETLNIVHMHVNDTSDSVTIDVAYMHEDETLE